MKHQDENLSLLLDDDSEADVDAVLDEVMADVNLQYRMRRYQIIGETLSNELPQAIDTDFHHGVMAKIREQSPKLEADDNHSDHVNERGNDRGNVVPLLTRAWFRPFAGLAVAASVAVVTVALWQPLQQQGTPNDGLVSADQQKIEQLAGQQVVGSAVPVSSRLQSGTRWKLEQESSVVQRKLNAYLVNHTEYSSSMQGLIPQARVAGFDAEQ
jgi:negative regulator of sigma E activity